MDTNTDPVRVQGYVAVPRAFLEQVYAMAREGCEAPATAYRWCERIDWLFHGGSLDEYDVWARQLPAALSQQPAAPSGEAVACCNMVDYFNARACEKCRTVIEGWAFGDAAPNQPAGVDGAPTWSRQQPTAPGIYGIRGFNLCRPASEQFEAVVVVREYGGELVCNLHESTSEDDLESWAPICDLDPDFEWRAFVPGWEQRGGRALAAQQQG